MSTKYYAKDYLLVQTTGLEIELDLSITYSVSKYRSATLTQPEEPRTVEIEEIKATFQGEQLELPTWLDGLTENDDFKSRLLELAAEQDICGAEDAADAKREREWEDWL